MMTNHKVCQDITGSCGWSRVLSLQHRFESPGHNYYHEDKYCTRTDCGILERGSLKTRNEEEEEGEDGGEEEGKKKKKNLATSFSTYPEEKCIIILFHTRLGSKAAKISL